ncbi:MAG TPA: SHOCT domain-containing protein [Chromatiaceae bacterium]|nr:SHOCT domain-containing protein [Chromatiaceae bacterium]
MYDGHWFGFGGGIMWLVWILIILAVVWVIRSAVSPDRGKSPPSQQDSALEILKARYARGEITAEEYQRMRRELEK